MEKFFKVCLLLFCFLAASGNVFAQTVYYVSTGGSDSNDGLSWSTAFATVQKGINEANTAGSSEVWVAAGTYYPTEYLSDATGQRTSADGNEYLAFSMYAGVNVYGGFAGTESSVAERQMNSSDPWDFTNPTILDGQNISYHVVWFATNGFYEENYEGYSGQVGNPLASQSILDGFTVTGGFANYPSDVMNNTETQNHLAHYSGGGVALVGKGEVHNCIVQNNRAKYSGAGIGMQQDSKALNSLIQNNEAIGARFYETFWGFPIVDYWRADGAGIAAGGNDTGRPLIDNCKIYNNLGQANDNYPGTPSTDTGNFNLGGGVTLYYADMTNSLISSNEIKKAFNDGSGYGGTGAGPSLGGGIYLWGNGTIDNCEVTDNGYVDNDGYIGAGMFLEDYNEEALSYDDILVKDSYVHSNRKGGAIANDSKMYSQIENCIVANNDGFGVYGLGNCVNARTVNCLIYNNSGYGWSNGNKDTYANTNNVIINSTVVNNGSGIGNGNSSGGGTYSLFNTVVWGNNNNPSLPNVSCEYSAFDFTPPAGTGNIQLTGDNTDAMFVNPTAAAGINQTGWQDAVWSVESGSNLVDAGYNSHITGITSTDIMGNDRNQGNAVDIGAYEFTFYQLSLSVDASGGGVATIVNNGSTNGLFAPGESITIQGTPESGYDFWKWTRTTGETINKLDEFSFTMPSQDVEMVAWFSENPYAPTDGLPAGTEVPVATTEMSWTAPSSGITPTNYQVYLYSEADGYTDPIIDGINVTGTSYDGMLLDMNTTYMAQVYAEYDPDAKGLSEPLEWYFKTENIVTYNVSVADDPDGSGIVLIDETGSTSGDFEEGTVINLSSTPQSGWNFWKWTKDGATLSEIDDFQYTVTAEDVQLLAHFYQDPEAPTNGLPNGSAELVTVDTLSWDPPASGSVPTSYTVYMYSDADLYATALIDSAEVFDTCYAPLDLEFGTTYKVKVYSNFDPEAKAQSSKLEWSFSTEEGSLAAPLDFTINGYELTWTAVDGAAGYRIYSQTDPYGSNWMLEAEVGAVTTWTDPDTSSTKKFYIITAIM